jgi:octanoyl-[GcvH]:protein N-octanoyltransferase
MMKEKIIQHATRSARLLLDDVVRPSVEQVHFDDELLSNITAEQAVVRLWLNTDSLVVSSRDARTPCFSWAVDTLMDEGVCIVQRSTGGTAVAHMPGTLNVSLIYSLHGESPFSIEESYRELVAPLIAYLNTIGLPAEMGEVSGAFCSGRYDVICEGKKLAGTAQRVRTIDGSRCVLSHYTLNVDNDVIRADELINRFYQLSGSKTRVTPDRASSLSELLVNSGKEGLSVARFIQDFVDYLATDKNQA